MRLYVEVARRGFRRFATYRGATFAGVFTNTVFGFVQAYVMLAVFQHRTDVGGFDATDAVTFVFATQAFLMPVGIFGGSGEIGARIRSGDVVSDLYRPVDFQAYWLALDLGRAGFHAVFRGVPPYLVGALVFDLRTPQTGALWAAFIASAVAAVVTSFGLRFLVGLAAFWVLDDRGPAQIVSAVWMFLGGFIVPITFFPDWLEHLARALPFAAMLQVPVEIFLGKHAGSGLLRALALQLAWAVALLALGRLVLGAATRKLVVQGG